MQRVAATLISSLQIGQARVFSIGVGHHVVLKRVDRTGLKLQIRALNYHLRLSAEHTLFVNPALGNRDIDMATLRLSKAKPGAG